MVITFHGISEQSQVEREKALCVDIFQRALGRALLNLMPFLGACKMMTIYGFLYVQKGGRMRFLKYLLELCICADGHLPAWCACF